MNYCKVYLSSRLYNANSWNPQSLKRECTTKTHDLHMNTNCITQCVGQHFNLKFPVVSLYDHFHHFCVQLNFRILTLDLWITWQSVLKKDVVKSNHPHITYTLFTGKRLLTTHEAKLKLVVTRKLPRDQEQLKGRITAPTFFFIRFFFIKCVYLRYLLPYLCSLVCSFLAKIWKPNICRRTPTPTPHSINIF